MTFKTSYAVSKFGEAVGMMTGPEAFAVRVAAAWSQIAVLKDMYRFENADLQGDFDWLMSKRSQFGVGDRMRAKATDAECDEVRHRILKIYGLLSE